MRNNYTNIPNNIGKDNTIKGFEQYQNIGFGTNSTVYHAMVGFFTNRGFEETAAELISETIITQAKQDSYNPMQILDTLRGLDQVEVSGIVAEILNFNRFKSSSLGYSPYYETYPEVARNILP